MSFDRDDLTIADHRDDNFPHRHLGTTVTVSVSETDRVRVYLGSEPSTCMTEPIGREQRDRLRAALSYLGYHWPLARHLMVDGSGCSDDLPTDAAVAVAILVADNQEPVEALGQFWRYELTLNGRALADDGPADDPDRWVDVGLLAGLLAQTDLTETALRPAR